jgi:hypothetical protein
MHRTFRKPGFWVALILCSFVINVIMAWITVHSHFPAAGDILLFGPTTQNKRGSDPIPESVVWHRMLQEHADETSSSSSSPCHHRNRTASQNYYPTISLRGGATNRTHLSPGGFRRDVGRFVREKRSSSSSPSSETCFLPPSSSCQFSKYSVVVYSEGKNVRQLFLNLLSFLAYPTVTDVALILPFDIRTKTSTWSNTNKDTPYGDRILEWVTRRTIRFLNADGETSLWSAMQTIPSEGSESILWINGDVRKDWTGASLKQTFQTWRANPRMLFASKVVVESSSSSSRCPFPDLHQLMMHRNFLCYLGHPVMNLIRQNVVMGSSSSSSSWNITQNAVSMIWNHVASGHVVVPPRLLTNETFETSIVVDKRNEADTSLILDYFECDCVWPSTTQLSSLNATCYQ